MKNIMGMAGIMKKAQAAQSQMAALQSKMEMQEFTGTAGNNMVQAVITGKNVPVSIKINPDVVDKNDVETLEDLILVALRAAHENAQAQLASEMARIQESLGLPADFKMPF